MPCASDPCQNQAECVTQPSRSTTRTYKCLCRPTFTGVNCQTGARASLNIPQLPEFQRQLGTHTAEIYPSDVAEVILTISDVTGYRTVVYMASAEREPIAWSGGVLMLSIAVITGGQSSLMRGCTRMNHSNVRSPETFI